MGERTKQTGGTATPVRRFPLQLLGMSLFFAWEILIAPFEQAWGVAELPVPLPRAHLYTLLTAALLAFVAVRARAVGHGPWGRRAVVTCGLCAAAVPLLDLMGTVAPAGVAAVLALVSTVLKAIANAGLFLAWNAQLAGHRAFVAWTAYAGSFVAMVGVFFLVRALGPVALAIGAVALPPLSCLLLEASRSLPREEAAAEGHVVWKFPWRPVILMVAFSFAYRLAQGFGGDLQVASELGRLTVAAVLLVCFVAAFDRFDVGLLFKVCPALVVAGLLLCLVETAVPSSGGVDLGLRGFLVSAGYSGFTLYVYMTLNTVCYRFGAPSDWLFGITRAACVLMSIPSSLLFDWLTAGTGTASAAGAVDVTALTAVSAVVVCLVLLSTLLLTDRTPVTTWGIKAVRIGNDEVGVTDQPIDTVSYLEDRVYRCALVARHFGLTNREEEVLSLLSQGSSLQEIESELSIAHGTLRAHVQHIYAKLGVHSYEEARDAVRTWRP